MKHEEIRHKLSEYIDGAISSQERAAIDEHIKTCPACTGALAELRKTIEQVKRIEEVEAPAWMTAKIMAKVRHEQDERSGILNRLAQYFIHGRAIQVTAVLFLTVTVYYIYSNMHPAEKYQESPVGHLAKQEGPAEVRDIAKRKAPARAERQENQREGDAAPAPHIPGYKSLDMKYSYEKPAPPAPSAAPSAPAPAMTKREATEPAREEMAQEPRAALPQTQAAAPTIMAEQTAPAAKASRTPASVQDTSASAGQKVDREAEARLAVAERFSKTDLPKKMKKKGLFYTIRSIQDEPADLRWLKDTTAYRTPCPDRYVVDVDLAGSLSKYVYCAEPSRVRLLGVYELRDGAWAEKKRP